MKIKDNFLSTSNNRLHLRLYTERNIENKKETEELICLLSNNINKVPEFIKTLILALNPYSPCKVMIRTKAEVKEIAKVLFKAGIKEFQVKNPDEDDLIMAINGKLYETFAIETQNLSILFNNKRRTVKVKEITGVDYDTGYQFVDEIGTAIIDEPVIDIMPDNPSLNDFQKLAEYFENFVGYFRKDFKEQGTRILNKFRYENNFSLL
jgi:hypothetical protein